MRKTTILAALLLLAPAVTQAKSLEELLAEKGVITRSSQGGTEAGTSKGYWNNGTRVDHSNGFTFGLATYTEIRYTFTDGDSDAGEGNSSSFDVRKARLVASGTALNGEFSYYVQGDFSSSEDGETGEEQAALRDAYLAWNACDYAGIKAGQFKTGISRQFNTSDWRLQFADRAAVSDAFDMGRQQGVRAWLDIGDSGKIGAAIFNGSSDGEGINRDGVDTRHFGVVDARFNVMGEMDAYSEGDIDETQDLAVNVGAAYGYDESEIAGAADVVESNVGSVDANLKTGGISVHAEFFWATVDVGSEELFESTGGYIQGGVFVLPKELEVAARYGFQDCDDGAVLLGDCAGNDNVNEATVGLNYYWASHNLKAQLNYSFLNEDGSGADGDDINTNRWLLNLVGYL